MKPGISPLGVRVVLAALILPAAVTLLIGCGGGGGDGSTPAAPRAWVIGDAAPPGGTAQAWLMVSDPTAVAGLDLDLTFDPNLLSVSSVTKAAVTDNFTMLYNDQPAGSLAVSMARATGLTGGTGTQALLGMEFVVEQSAQPGASIPLSVALAVYNQVPSPLSVQVEESEITVE
jgi:hypothetical protein